MNIFFYTSAVIVLTAALLAITRRNAMHAILYLIVLLLAMATLFYLLGAPFIAALQVIIYAGAIMVLFLFVVMMINPAREVGQASLASTSSLSWFGPVVLVTILGIEWVFLFKTHTGSSTLVEVGAGDVGKTLFHDYFIGVQLVALLLLVGLIGAFHLGSKRLNSRGCV